MKKLIFFTLFLIPINSFAFDDAFDSVKTKNIETISKHSTDVNVDKLKVQISDDLVIESWFWNNSSSGNELIYYIEKILKYLTLFISIVAVVSIIYISIILIFVQEQWKIKEYKSMLLYIILWFVFYWFIAWWLYVWIIKQWEKYSSPYYDNIIKETLKNEDDLTPTLLK